MKVSDYVIEFLVQNNIDKVFGYIGGNNAHLFDSVDRHDAIELVNARHEQGAGFAAEGYASVTGKTGVAVATSGPGGTNLITPIASCFLDSVPSLFIVGDINSFERDKSKGMRQIGFQDIDIENKEKTMIQFSNYDPGSMKTQMQEKLRHEDSHFYSTSKQYIQHQYKNNNIKDSQESAQILVDKIITQMKEI